MPLPLPLPSAPSCSVASLPAGSAALPPSGSPDGDGGGAAPATAVELARSDSGSGSRFVQLRRHISGEAPLTGDEHSPLGGASAAPADRWTVDEAGSGAAGAPANASLPPPAAASSASVIPVRVMPLELLQPKAVPSYALLGSLARMFNRGDDNAAGSSVEHSSAAAGSAVVGRVGDAPDPAAGGAAPAPAAGGGRTLFSLIIGADLLPTLPSWAHAQLLLRESSFLVVPRPGYPLRLRFPLRSESGASSHERIAAGFGSTLVYLPPGDPAIEPHCAWLVRHPDGSALETPEVSSTAVRLAVAQASAAGPGPAGRAAAGSGSSGSAGAAPTGGAGAAGVDCDAGSGAGGAPSVETASFPWSAAARLLTPSVLHYMRDSRLYI